MACFRALLARSKSFGGGNRWRFLPAVGGVELAFGVHARTQKAESALSGVRRPGRAQLPAAIRTHQ
jgi:hypothetical protein